MRDNDQPADEAAVGVVRRAMVLATLLSSIVCAAGAVISAESRNLLAPSLALVAWSLAKLLDRAAPILGSVAIVVVCVAWLALQGSTDPAAGAIAVVAVAAAASSLGQFVKARPAFAEAISVSALGATTYVGVFALILAAPRQGGTLPALPALVPLAVAATIAAGINWRRLPPPGAIAILAALGIVVSALLGIATGAPFLADFVPGHTIVAAEGAVAVGLVLFAAFALERGATQTALAILVPVVMLALYVLAIREQIPARQALPAAFGIEWWLKQRMLPLSAVVLLISASGVAAATMVRHSRHWLAVAWSCGLILILIALLSLVATALGAIGVTMPLVAEPAAVPMVLCILALGLSLLLRHPDRPRLLSAWLPLLGGSVVLAATLGLAQTIHSDRIERDRREADAAAEAARAAILGALEARLALIERLGERLLSVSPEQRPSLFDVEATQALRANLAVQSVARVGADRIVRQIQALNQSVRLLGTNAAFDDARRHAYDSAQASGKAVALGPLILARTEIEALLVIYPGPFGRDGVEFLVASFRFDDLLMLALQGVASGHAIEATTGGRRKILRGEPSAGNLWESAPGREFDALGGRWTVRALPLSGRSGESTQLARSVLGGGIAIALLLAVALRFAGLARERARAAEAAAAALRAESAARELTQVELDRSRRQAQRLLEGMSEGVIMLDRDLRITYVNAHGRAMIHSIAPAPIGVRLQDVFSLFKGSDFERALESVLTLRHETALEAYSVGLSRWLAGRIYPVDDGLTAIFSDVTEPRRAAQFETEQREVLRAIASGAPLMESVAKCVRLYETRFDGAIGSALRYDATADVLFGAVAPSLPVEFNRLWEGAKPGPEACSCGTAVFRRELVVVEDIADSPLWRGSSQAALELGLRACWSIPIIAADGAIVGTFAAYYRSVRRPTAEESAGLESVASLIGIALERERAERDIEASRQRFRSLFERSPSMVYAFDLERRLVDCNENAVREGGFPREALLGIAAERLVLPQYRCAVEQAFLAALRGEPSSIDAAVMTATRRRREVSATLVPIAVDGRIVGVFGIVQDVTDARRLAEDLDRALQDLRSRNRELQDFAFVASHDLQEPLRKVQAFSDRVIQRYSDQLDPQAVDYLTRIDSAAHRMQVLIDDLLAYSRVTSQGQPFAPVDLNAVARETLSDLEVRIDESGAQVELGTLPELSGDRTQLRQLLQNLLANALKFRARARTPKIVVDAVEAEPGYVTLRVTDNGIGFEQQHAERIFAPFQRLHGRQEYDGTGIGLAVVRRIVDRHAGRIRAIGRPGQGASFEVTLPLRSDGPG